MRRFRDRLNHLCWTAGDLDLDLHEREEVLGKPGKKFQAPDWMYGDLHRISRDDMRAKDFHPADHEGFRDHNEKVYSDHGDTLVHAHIYKRWSSINGILRNSRREGSILIPDIKSTRDFPHLPSGTILTDADKAAEHTRALERVTSYQTRAPATVWRGVDRGAGIHLKSPGQEFMDHGFTGTSLRPEIAEDFAGEHHGGPLDGRRILARIHVPAGTKGHYLESDKSMAEDFQEHEFLLHRGTRFRVMGHSIGSDTRVHVMHLRVVGQHPKNLVWRNP